MTERRNVIVHIGISADGYIARPDGDLEWLTSAPSFKVSMARRFLWHERLHEVVLVQFDFGTRILRVIHWRDARATLFKLNQYP
jgi:hypothetical protein